MRVENNELPLHLITKSYSKKQLRRHLNRSEDITKMYIKEVVMLIDSASLGQEPVVGSCDNDDEFSILWLILTISCS